MTHSWANTAETDRHVCVDCGTARWFVYVTASFDQYLYLIPGEKVWSAIRPDCAAVAADKMRTDRGVS